MGKFPIESPSSSAGGGGLEKLTYVTWERGKGEDIPEEAQWEGQPNQPIAIEMQAEAGGGRKG